MNDLEDRLRERLAGLSEPALAAPVDLASRLRRRHDRRRLAAPIGTAACLAAVAPWVAVQSGSRSRAVVMPPSTSPTAVATSASASPEPTKTLDIAGLTFTLPASMHVAPDVQGISQDVTRHDNTRRDGPPSYATDVALTDGERELSITVYDGELARTEAELFLGSGEHPVVVAGRPGRAGTTISMIPPNVSPDMAAQLSRPFVLLLVKVSRDRTLLLGATGFSEQELMTFATDALAGQ